MNEGVRQTNSESLNNLNIYGRSSASGLSINEKISGSRNNLASILKSAIDGVSFNGQKSDDMQRKTSDASTIADPFTRFSSSQEMYRTLAFKDEETEKQYKKYFFRKIRGEFRIVIASASVALICYFIYLMASSPSNSSAWKSRQEGMNISESMMLNNYDTYCPKGFYCVECFGDNYCGDYKLPYDIIFMIIAVFPGLLALLLRQIIVKDIKDWYQIVCSSITLFWVSVGILIRQAVMAPFQTDYFNAMMMISLTFFASLGLQLRFIYAAITYFILSLIWLITVLLRSSYQLYHSSTESVISAVVIFACGVVLVFTLHRQEKFYRQQFLRGIFNNKVNSKLIGHLKSLQKTFTVGAIDIESPLEKSLSIIRSLLADSSLNGMHMQSLELVARLLNNPQLLTPDIEGQLTVNSDSESNHKEGPSTNNNIDNDQKAWLLTEIAKRKSEVKRTQSIAASKRKRKSVHTSSFADKVGVTEIPAMPRSNSKKSTMITYSESNNVDEALIEEEIVIAIQNRDPFTYASVKAARSSTESSTVLSTDILSSFMQIGRPAKAKKSIGSNPTAVQTLLSQMESWNFKIFDLADACPGGRPLFMMIWHLFDGNGLFEDLNLPLEKFNNFVWTIQEGYRELPYHNAIHASDVLHAVNYFSQYEEVYSVLAPLELAALYLAAAVHDYDHPGLNNNFLITTKNPLALLYNDKSVLESYHASSAFQVLLRPENNFLSELPHSEWQAFRDLVIEMVLATDLSQHYATLTQFKTRLQNGFNPQVKDDRVLLVKMLIKCADVSNPTKEFSLYHRWTNAVLEEWRLQGDMEKKMNIPVSPFMDRDNPNIVISSQIGFIDFIIIPMFESIHGGFMSLKEPMEELQKNRDYWAKLKEDDKRTLEAMTSTRESRMSLKNQS